MWPKSSVVRVLAWSMRGPVFKSMSGPGLYHPCDRQCETRIIEFVMRKPGIYICKNNDADHLCYEPAPLILIPR